MILKMFLKEARLQTKIIFYLLFFMTLGCIFGLDGTHFFIIIGILYLGYDMTHKEVKANTLPFLVTKPISRESVIIIKYVSGIIMILGIFLISILSCLAIKHVMLPLSSSLAGGSFMSIPFLNNIPRLPSGKILLDYLFKTVIFYYSASFFTALWFPSHIMRWVGGLIIIGFFNSFIFSFFPNIQDYLKYIIFAVTSIFMLISSVSIFNKNEIGGA